jgi:hypothetical protein
MNTRTSLNPDRLVWLALLAVMVAALVTDQARANLQSGARAAVRYQVPADDNLTAAGWCRLYGAGSDLATDVLPVSLELHGGPFIRAVIALREIDAAH